MTLKSALLLIACVLAFLFRLRRGLVLDLQAQATSGQHPVLRIVIPSFVTLTNEEQDELLARIYHQNQAILSLLLHIGAALQKKLGGYPVTPGMIEHLVDEGLFTQDPEQRHELQEAASGEHGQEPMSMQDPLQGQEPQPTQEAPAQRSQAGDERGKMTNGKYRLWARP
jgi:hypothetical protein